MLTATEVKNLKPRQKAYKKSDEKGLYLKVMPSGAKYWRFKYYFPNEKHLALGVYPEVSLAKAREDRDDARQLIRKGIDPGEDRKRKNAERSRAKDNTFGKIADSWINAKKSG